MARERPEAPSSNDTIITNKNPMKKKKEETYKEWRPYSLLSRLTEKGHAWVGSLHQVFGSGIAAGGGSIYVYPIYTAVLLKISVYSYFN